MADTISHVDEPQKHAKQKKPSHEWPFIDQIHVCKMAPGGKSINRAD